MCALNIYAAMVTGPQNMPVFSKMTLSEDDKRDIISALLNQQEMKSARRFHARITRPGLC